MNKIRKARVVECLNVLANVAGNVLTEMEKDAIAGRPNLSRWEAKEYNAVITLVRGGVLTSPATATA
jgi:hypothetical protein